MKVLHVVAALAERYGGPSRNVVGLCAATRALGVDAEICATNADGPGGCLDVPSDERIVWHGVPVRFFRRTWSETYKYSAPLSGWLRSRVQDFDLIVTHGCFSFAPEAAAVAARRAGVPYLVVPHGMLAEWALTRRRKQVHLRLRTRTLVRAARGFICTSAREEQEVTRLVGHAPSTLRVNWGIPADALAAAPADGHRWRERHGLPTDRKMVLFLGRLHPKKGIHDQLLPAMAHASGNWLLVIAGPEDAHTPRYVDVVRRTVQEYGLTDRVFFTGPLGSREKLDALDACDVFVLPSHSENFAVTVAEAMARARPVIVSEAVQIADEVGAAGAGIVVPLDPPRLADALSRVLSDPGLAQSLGASGRAFVARELSWETAARRVCDFYRRVLHDRAAG